MHMRRKGDGMNKSKIFFIFLFFCCSWAQGRDVKPEISVHGNKVYVMALSGKTQTISFDHEMQSEDVKIEDLTFNGYLDLKILKDQGATQKFYSVYLYSPRLGVFIFNKKMSDIPCLQIDIERKQLMGACFHESSCENWTERYAVSRDGTLSLVERNGAYCDPTGQAYTYVDRFKNGKQISSKITPVPDNPQQSSK